MLVSKHWIEQFTTIPKDISSEKLGEDLTLHVVEVEGIVDEARFLDTIVVGKILSLAKHDNADSLHVCQVDVGNETLQVVCGGSNVREGMLVAMGKVGARVRWHGEGELVELVNAKIRGVESAGMICASEEIGLGDMFPKTSEKEILDLSEMKLAVGTPLADALGLDDIVYDIDNKSMTHRPDLWGQYGMAREVAAMYGQVLKTYEPASIGKVKNGNWELDIDVQDADACPRYMGVVMSGIDVGESPAWMKKRLMSVGVPSINNIVDITNYLLLELGQPMHAFDAGQLGAQENGISLIVRKAKSGEQFVALDEKEYELSIDDLVIATPTRAVAIAGVKGGLNSGITSATTSIVFESANFDAVTVRRTSTRLGLRTDASARYEKSLDPVQCELALRRAVELVREMCPNAVVSSAVVDQSNFAVAEGPIELDTTFVRRKMGVDLPTKEMVRILESLGFGVKEKKDVLSVTVPSWRATKDIAIREDLVEEIARVYGYGNIPASLPTFPIVPPVRNPLRDLETTLRELLAYEHGYTEVSNYSFVSPEWLKRLGITDQSAYIALENPIAKDRPLLRRNLLPSMLQNVEQNLHRFDAVRLFEIGKTYRAEVPGDDAGDGTGALPKQDTILGCVYAKKGDDTPFFSLHGTLASVAQRMGWTIRLEKRTEADVFPTHPGRYATIYIQDVHVGRMGELHPQTADELGIPYRTAMMEINLSEIIAIARKEKSVYQPLSQYPVVERDIAFLVDVSVAHDDIATCLITADILTVKAELFDVFTGNTVPHGKKSMAYRLTYRSDEKTLETSEVETVHKKIIDVLKKKFDAELR